ncbi:MAG: valine--tRNA ligase [Oscillospiraceae bacterium]|nr:valine--tRNA ligase [Oscillospiraceae bacterium]
MRELPKLYDPKAVEQKIYQFWMDGGYFRGVIDPNKEPFTIVIPPPNVTGQLHLGHAFDETIQDAIIRHRRMQGYAALWVPGTDHAGIATQIKVEEQLRKEEGKSRFDLGREAFLERVWKWKEEYGGRITEQLKTLGSSCDWDRERFTMDEGLSRAVREAFVSLYEKGLIYKGVRIINWCPECTTALSDTEVEHEEQEGGLYFIQYPVIGTDEHLIVATTRPETMLGDTGVAVHPEDKRYAHLVGKTIMLPLMNREIPIVADDYVDMEFGTGCVKMTPCHDPNDFLVAQRHNLEQILVLDENACVNENGGKYCGMDRLVARKAVLEDLKALGILVKQEIHKRNVGTCYRCSTIVEPMTSPQWFVKMEPLAKEALEVVEDGRIEFIPERFTKVYRNWMENAHDWCISRQLWWGHQIPAWYCAPCGHITVSREDPAACEKCGSAEITRDEDVLDTWFSSALWPFSVFGWPEKTPDLAYFYPTSVLVTGYDILFFWVARMIFSGLEQMGEAPFHTVLLHGLIRDSEGQKMSKSAGNGVDPIEVIDTYGADALRFNIITGNSPGNDMRYYNERCEAYRNFANKIWNAARFVMMNLTIEENRLPETLELEDKWILSQLNRVTREVNESLERYELGIAASKIYDFIWDTYCDWYIELTKPRLNGEDEAGRESAQRVLLFVLVETLKLLHPFMPFITEEIWQALPHEGEALMVETYPAYQTALDFPAEEAQFEKIMAAVRAIRVRRSEMKVPPSKKSSARIVTDDPETFLAGRVYFGKLASVSELEITAEAPQNMDGQVSVVTQDARIFLPMAELVDLDAERARIAGEIEKAQKVLEAQENKLANEAFVQRAKEHVVAAEREKAEAARALIHNLQESLKQLEV